MTCPHRINFTDVRPVICLTSMAVSHQAAASVLSCRSLNPYVLSALGDWRKLHLSNTASQFSQGSTA